MSSIHRAAYIAGFFVLLASTAHHAGYGGSGNKRFAIQSSSPSEIVVTFTPGEYQIDSLLVDGVMHSFWVLAGGGSTGETGRPLLPTDGFLLALPPSSNPVIELLESTFEEVRDVNIAPVPSYSMTDEQEGVAHYTIDRDFYSQHDQWYPASSAVIGSIGTVRHTRCGSVIIHPVQYNPSRKTLRKALHLKLRIRFGVSPASHLSIGSSGIVRDPFFDESMERLILNFDQARDWRVTSVSRPLQAPGDTGAGWFDTDRDYIRLTLSRDSIYRLSYADLAAQGLYLDQISASTLALYTDGVSIPILASLSDSDMGNWYLEFYGRRNRGPAAYYDEYSDSNTYWLTWNDPNPNRYVPVSVPAGIPSDTATWHRQVSHFEQDNTYFFGVTQDEIQNPRKVPGEGWFLIDFVSATSRILTFAVDTVKQGTGTSVAVRARFHGMTLCQSPTCRPPSRHSARILLNGTDIGSVDWTDNTEALFSTSVPDTLLRNGSNSLQITSRTWAPQDSNISRFYLDWYEIEYPRPILLSTSPLIVQKGSTPPGITAFRAEGPPTDSITVLDMTNGRLLETVTSAGPGSFVILDTLTAPCEYLIIRSGLSAAPAISAMKRFPDLRTRTSGADYLVVTHGQFAAEANRLAGHRTSTNGVRSAVVDIQDIYDEFNFGNPDPDALKRFLNYAYDFWPAPAPSYLVLFGDASWDFKRLVSSSVKTNFVPSYGNPPSDNALVAFDSLQYYLPSMIVGRIPVETPAQAQQIVTKIIQYDSPPLSEWNKSFLLVTGGDTPAEKNTFNFWSNGFINTHITPAPLGGKASTVYKTTDAIIDGENKPLLQSIVNGGIVFLNFIGHSGGRIWSVDIGRPDDLQNTNGKLPFVSSVSCNVGFFSDPRSNVLAEDFLLADNRGAIGVWAGSSIGYGSVGRALVDYLLSSITADSVRRQGDLTNLARLRYWTVNPLTPLVIQTLDLHPLIGDPMCPLAIPLKPDFHIAAEDISTQEDPPTADSTVTLRVSLHNYGLMAGRSIPIDITDGFTPEMGRERARLIQMPAMDIPDFGLQDSFFVTLDVSGKPGDHMITVRIDPADSIDELDKSNNLAQRNFYVYRHTISAVAPVLFSVITETSPVLTVTIPSGNDTTTLVYTFQIDTIDDFSSGYLITSPDIVPDAVTAQWQSPVLPLNKIHYWRSRSFDGAKFGAWRASSFAVQSAGGNADTTIWRQRGRSQLSGNAGAGVSISDSGVTLIMQDSSRLFVRSVGNRYNQTAEYYSTIRINTATAIGYWWQSANSYLAGRYDPSNGSYALKGFDLLRPGAVDSMTAFLSTTPSGSYILLCAVLNGRQNMTETLYQLIEQLGSTSIRSLLAGQSWSLIARKGDGTAVFESYEPSGIAEGSVTIANTYSRNSGSLLSSHIGPSDGWIAGSWDVGLPGSSALVSLNVLGIRTDGSVDTLLAGTQTSGTFDLSSINSQQYPYLRYHARLSNTDGSTTPLLRAWSATYVPPPDLAISPRTFSTGSDSVKVNTPLDVTLTVHNTGTRTSNGGRAVISFADDSTRRVDLILGSLAPGISTTIDTHIVAGGSTGLKSLKAEIFPAPGSNDLLPENNLVIRPVVVTDVVSVSEIRVLADGKPIRDGDYLAAEPIITIDLTPFPASPGLDPALTPVTIDGKPLQPISASEPVAHGVAYRPRLEDGEHLLEVFHGVERLPSQILWRTRFSVASTAGILNLLNYPNPFRDETAFTFTLTGTRTPDELTIRIYTLAGRLVRSIQVDPSQLRIGFNFIRWDGRDEAGDEIANGTYLFRVTVKEANQSATELGRLTRLR